MGMLTLSQLKHLCSVDYSLEWPIAGVEPDVLDEGRLALEHAVAVQALEVRCLALEVVLPQLNSFPLLHAL